MSDISLNLSGFFIFLILSFAAGSLALLGLISLIFAFFTASKLGQLVKDQPAFSFFRAAAALIFLNLVVLGLMQIFLDMAAEKTNDIILKIVVFFWLPLQLVAWIVSGVVINKYRKQ